MIPDLDTLLDRHSPAIAAQARALHALLGRIAPDLTPQVRLGWGSVNFRHARAGFVCAIFPYPNRVSLIFEQGRQLSNHSGLLQGDGRQIRFIAFAPGAVLPEPELTELIAEAIALRA
jgi:hypothetical protein